MAAGARIPRLGATVTLCSGALLLAAAPLGAHSFDPALLDLRARGGGQFDVVWKLPAQVQSGATRPLPVFPEHCRWVSGEASTLDDEGPLTWRIDCGERGLGGAELRVRGFDGPTDVLLRIRGEDGRTFSAVLRSESEVFLVPAAAGGLSTRGALVGYLELGVRHILMGADHLLFVLALLLLVSRPAQLLRTVTAFTLGHSLTLALAALDRVRVSPRPVEALIALSVAVLAAELARAATGPLTMAGRRPAAVAALFGLLHGLGFAGALAAHGLPAKSVVAALIAFNLGVEIGQVLFVAVAVWPVRYWRRAVRRPLLRAAPAYAIGSVAMAWVAERVLAVLARG